MLHIPKAYSWLLKEKPKKWFSFLLFILMLVNIFSPVISLMTFRLHFDKHIVECRHHRHHDEYCQALCILEEMMPEQAEAIPEKAISLTYFFSDLFQNQQLIPTAQLSEIMMVNLFSHHFILYSSPTLGVHSPPPKL